MYVPELTAVIRTTVEEQDAKHAWNAEWVWAHTRVYVPYLQPPLSELNYKSTFDARFDAR